MTTLHDMVCRSGRAWLWVGFLVVGCGGSDAAAGLRDAGQGLPDAHLLDADAQDSSALKDSAAPEDANDSGGMSRACDASGPPELARLGVQSVVDGLQGLTFATQAPGSDDWYLVEQAGTIRIFGEGGLRATPFLDIRGQVGALSSGSFDDERGLLGLAFAPDYADSGRFFVMMTPTTGESSNRDMVVGFERDQGDPYLADASTMETILSLPSSAVNHNGGHLVFGPDGMLYVGTGDGGGSFNNNQPGAPQQTGSLFGKILRLDLTAGAQDYAASGNPFADDPRVLHIGLRNPYRFSFDRETGDLFVGDVGQDDYEEVDFAPAGASGINFGWATYEATHEVGRGFELNASIAHTLPIVEVDRRSAATGPFSDYKSVIGGSVYRGSAIPFLWGVYLFGDYVGDRMGALYQCGSVTSEITPVHRNCDPNAPAEACLEHAVDVPRIDALTAIVEDHAGELYLVVNRNQLVKIVAQ